MAARAVSAVSRVQGIARAFGLACVSLLAACGTVENVGSYTIVLQDRYAYSTCTEIANMRAHYTARVKELTDLVNKAESAPGGFIVSGMSYRSELAQARAHVQFAAKAEREKNCPAKP
jgi:hypothetical protein